MDLISRQAAIDVLSLGKEILSRVLDDMYVVGTEREKYSWGLGLIESNIKDIEELPSVQPDVPDRNVGDMISRQVALKEIEEWILALYENAHHESASDGKLILNAIKHLPSAQLTHTNTPNTLKSLDCVDRQAAIDHFKSITVATSIGNKYNEGFVDGLDFSVGHLKTMPSVQPEIVRCKDCKWYELPSHKITENCVRWMKSNGILLPIKPNDYCSYAERRTDAD